MIKQVKYYDGLILNLSGVMANLQYTEKCEWLVRCEAESVRKLWSFDKNVPVIHEMLVDRAEQLVQLAKQSKKASKIKAVWIRPMKSAPFFYAYVEDAFLSNGFDVVIPVEEFDPTVKGHHKFRVDGWWVIPPFTDTRGGEIPTFCKTPAASGQI
ncbi:MAG: hypothetical protein Q4A60_07360 [Pasteurellaceae bacterium]|nr:hypothetical protein [Pasteurellaceae bacterium]